MDEPDQTPDLPDPADVDAWTTALDALDKLTQSRDRVRVERPEPPLTLDVKFAAMDVHVAGEDSTFDCVLAHAVVENGWMVTIRDEYFKIENASAGAAGLLLAAELDVEFDHPIVVCDTRDAAVMRDLLRMTRSQFTFGDDFFACVDPHWLAIGQQSISLDTPPLVATQVVLQNAAFTHEVSCEGRIARNLDMLEAILDYDYVWAPPAEGDTLPEWPTGMEQQ